MIKDKYSYDSISGIWWSEKSKPGILEKKDEHITSLEAKLSIALAEVNKHLDEVKRLRIVANKYAEAYYHKSSDNGKGGVRNGMPGEPVSESRVDKAAPPETHTPEKSEGIKCAKCGSEAVLVNNGATYSDDVYCLKCGEIKVKRKQVLDGKWSQWR
jgi:formylmethanofuran dehydrogenase subunit E